MAETRNSFENILDPMAIIINDILSLYETSTETGLTLLQKRCAATPLFFLGAALY